MDETTSTPKHRLRFSFLNLLLLLTVSACAAGIVNFYLTNNELKKQNRWLSVHNESLRREIGDVVSMVPTVLCAHGFHDTLDDPNDIKWSWMVNVPQEGKYELRFAAESLPPVGYPKQYSALPIMPGVNRVTLFFYYDYETGDWMQRAIVSSVGHKPSSFRQDVKYSGERWMETLDRGGQIGGIDTPARQTVPIHYAKKGEPFLLKQFVWHKPKKGSSIGTRVRTGDGYKIWIKEVL